MEVASTVAEMRALRRGYVGDVGFVPTLGYLHAGHVSLLRASREQMGEVVRESMQSETYWRY